MAIAEKILAPVSRTVTAAVILSFLALAGCDGREPASFVLLEHDPADLPSAVAAAVERESPGCRVKTAYRIYAVGSWGHYQLELARPDGGTLWVELTAEGEVVGPELVVGRHAPTDRSRSAT